MHILEHRTRASAYPGKVSSAPEADLEATPAAIEIEIAKNCLFRCVRGDEERRESVGILNDGGSRASRDKDRMRRQFKHTPSRSGIASWFDFDDAPGFTRRQRVAQRSPVVGKNLPDLRIVLDPRIRVVVEFVDVRRSVAIGVAEIGDGETWYDSDEES